MRFRGWSRAHPGSRADSGVSLSRTEGCRETQCLAPWECPALSRASRNDTRAVQT